MSTKKIQILDSLTTQPDWDQTDETKSDYIKNKPLNKFAQMDTDIQTLNEKTSQFVVENNMLCITYETEEVE
jgi:hypothetical protein